MKGSCLCGAIAYEATPPASGLHIGLCSCRSCRKAHAAPANVYATVPRANFRWLRGEDKTHLQSSPAKPPFLLGLRLAAHRRASRRDQTCCCTSPALTPCFSASSGE